ncbi:hypothetical protein ACNR9Q_01280 [Maribacter sp. X9]|uniref:hypothetical protein n=1 Tax=Maribacter sp. X9 TaxID=3402159 RepID=UPI003AF34EA6
MGIESIGAIELADRLLKVFYMVGVDYSNVKGCRFNPNVYITTEEIDMFVKAVQTLAKEA